MFKHYLKLFFKHFIKHRLYSLLNILGLGISLSIALLIGLFVHHQLSYERHFEHAERIYQIGQRSTSNRFGSPDASSPLVASRFPVLFPSIEYITRSSFNRQVLLEAQGEAGSNDRVENMECCIGHADEQFFKVFNFDWLFGDPDTALSQPDSVVLTRPLARKYFGSEEAAFGSTLLYERDKQIRVTGIIEKLPDNTSLQFQALLSMNLYLEQYLEQFDAEEQSIFMENWEGAMFRTYARFNKHIPGDQLLAEMQPAIDAELGELAEKITFNIRPITRLYLDQNMGRVRVFAAIGIAILLIAIINFVNLTTARASTRATEIGLKSSLGATRAQLVRQFLFEGFTMVILAIIIALVSAELLLPVAGTIMGVELSFSVFSDPGALILLFLSIIVIGILPGLYPAFYLTSLKPVQSLKNETVGGKGNQYFRGALVVLQFSVSITLIISTLVFFLQIRYTAAFDREFDYENVVVIPFPEEDEVRIGSLWLDLSEDLKSHPQVDEINLSHVSPMTEGIIIQRVRKADSPDWHQISMLNSASDFLQFYGIDLLQGEYFPHRAVSTLAGRASLDDNDKDGADKRDLNVGVILNEAALSLLEWQPDEAIGRTLYLDPHDEVGSTVIGVVKNVITNLGRTPEPYLYTVASHYPGSRFIPARLNIRLDSDEHDGAMAHIRQVWADYFPDHFMQPSFLSERLRAQTRRQESQLRFFMYASVFAILVTCFGLFGLATFNAERRIKEIGVRKVMGGSVWSIVLLLTNDFSKLVLISNLIAWPVAYIAMNRWLENFAYRIDLTPLIFIGSGLIALCIAWVTVCGTAAKAASAKPILALRYE